MMIRMFQTMKTKCMQKYKESSFFISLFNFVKKGRTLVNCTVCNADFCCSRAGKNYNKRYHRQMPTFSQRISKLCFFIPIQPLVRKIFELNLSLCKDYVPLELGELSQFFTQCLSLFVETSDLSLLLWCEIYCFSGGCAAHSSML